MRNVSIRLQCTKEPLKLKLNSTLSQTGFLCACSTSLLKTLGKGEIALNEQFLSFPQCFITVWRNFCHFYQI